MRDHMLALPASHVLIHSEMSNPVFTPLLCSHWASPHFGCYSFSILLKVGCLVGLDSWLCMVCTLPHPLKLVTHPSTNRVWRRLTLLIHLVPLPLCQTATSLKISPNLKRRLVPGWPCVFYKCFCCIVWNMWHLLMYSGHPVLFFWNCFCFIFLK